MYIMSMLKAGASDFIKVNMLLCRVDTCFSFWFIKSVIGFWTADLFREISSTTKVDRLSRKQRSKVKTCPSKITLVLEIMSDGHISKLGKRKKICYKYNITDFPWNTFLWEGKIVWYNHQLYPHINWIAKIWISIQHD